MELTSHFALPELTTLAMREEIFAALVARQSRFVFRVNSVAVVVIGKATTLFSSDDLNTKRKLQLELTATPIK